MHSLFIKMKELIQQGKIKEASEVNLRLQALINSPETSLQDYRRISAASMQLWENIDRKNELHRRYK